MRKAESLFVVIEGLDGSGKTSAGRELATRLQAYLGGKVKLSFEPNDGCCGGLYIRQVLEKKIKRFSYETLAYAFAANRKDHGDRLIRPWLEKGDQQVFISDRYYLSSLVYQSNDKLSMPDIMELNRFAMQPDVIFFLSVTPEICYQRMDNRNKPQELFEENFVHTREKYHQAINFLRTQRQEQIVEIDASGTLDEVVQLLAKRMSDLFPQLIGFGEYVSQAQYKSDVDYSYDPKNLPLTITEWKDQSVADLQVAQFEQVTAVEKGSLFLDILKHNKYIIKGQLNLPEVSGFELLYTLPGDIEQSGCVLFVSETLEQAPLMTVVESLAWRLDFIFVIIPDAEHQNNVFFQRDTFVYRDGQTGLFPVVKFYGSLEIENWLTKTIKSLQ